MNSLIFAKWIRDFNSIIFGKLRKCKLNAEISMIRQTYINLSFAYIMNVVTLIKKRICNYSQISVG